MVIIDRVVCDFCYCVVGQLFTMSAVSKDCLNDLGRPPFFCVCPDCFDTSVLYVESVLMGFERGISSD